jgi:hypothetical protein
MHRRGMRLSGCRLDGTRTSVNFCIVGLLHAAITEMFAPVGLSPDRSV